MSVQTMAQALKMSSVSREKVSTLHPESSPKKAISTPSTTKSAPILGATPQPMSKSKLLQGCDPFGNGC